MVNWCNGYIRVNVDVLGPLFPRPYFWQANRHCFCLFAVVCVCMYKTGENVACFAV